jgi:hypothetical protein
VTTRRTVAGTGAPAGERDAGDHGRVGLRGYLSSTRYDAAGGVCSAVRTVLQAIAAC